MKNGIVALVALAGLASGASATNSWSFDLNYTNQSGRIEKAGDSVTVTLFAGFDDNLYAFAASALSVMTGDATGSWSNIGTDFNTGPQNPGVANGGDVNGIIT